MILDWLVQTPVILVAGVVVFVPGILALRAVGLRGLGLIAAAPLFGVAATALLGIALAAVGVAWSGLTWAVGMLALVALAAAAGWLLRGTHAAPHPHPHPHPQRRWVLPASITLGVVLGAVRLGTYIGRPDAISQTNDAVFHMNAVRFIVEHGDASSLHVSEMIGGSGFYPAAWHAIVSLVVLVTGADIPTAANALTLVIGALIWTTGIVWLTRVVTRSDEVAAVAAILSAALQTFPLLMFQWGVLFPNALSVSLLPAAVATVISLPLWADFGMRWRAIVRSLLLLLVSVTALALSQPSSVLPWAAIVLLWGTAELLRRRSLSATLRWIVIVVAWAVLAGFWLLLSRGTSGSHWPPFRGKLEVLLDVLLNGQLRIPFAIGVSLLMLAGLVVAWRSVRMRWFVVAWAGVSALYYLVAAVGAPWVRINLLGAWYADPYRIAALAPIVVIPLAAIGLHAAVSITVAAIVRRRGKAVGEGVISAASVATAVVFMVIVVLVRPVAMPSFIEGTFDRDSRYVAAPDSYLSPDERTLLESLDEHVEPGARVIGNPSTGAGFGYLFSGVDVYPRTWATPRADAWAVLADRLRDAATDPTVCDALEAYSDPDYVLDFGIGDRTSGRYESPGLSDFAGQPGFEEVAAVGDASLWRITACAR